MSLEYWSKEKDHDQELNLLFATLETDHDSLNGKAARILNASVRIQQSCFGSKCIGLTG